MDMLHVCLGFEARRMSPQAMLVFLLGITLIGLSMHEYWSPQIKGLLE